MLVGATHGDRARARERARARVLGEGAYGGEEPRKVVRASGRNASRDRALLALSLALVVGGCLLACSPWLADTLTRWGSSADFVSTASGTYPSSEDDERLVEQARAYNERLAGSHSEGAIVPYEQQLSRVGTSVIATVDFPRFGTRVPVGHGTSDETLSLEAGHLEGSSLPVGGTSTHCVICGHSGMFGRQLFDCLHRMGEGDVFEVDSAAGKMAYRVVSVEALTPDEADRRLSIEPGNDLTTLVTCTPYGVNDHRLLMKGVRCDVGEAEQAAREASPLDRVDGRLVPACVLAAIAVCAMAAARVCSVRHRRVRSRRRSRARRHIRLGNG